MKNHLKRNIYIGFVVASFLTGLISYFYYKSTDDFIQSSEAVQHSVLRSRQLERVLSLLKDAETGERGYIITRREVFLEPYQLAITNLNSEVTGLKQLTSGHAYYRHRLRQLDSLIGLQIGVLNDNVRLVQLGRLQQVTEIVASGKAKRLLDAIRSAVGEMQQFEENQLIELQIAARQDVTVNYLVNYTGIAITIILFSLGFWIITTDLNHREKLEKALAASNEELLSVNEELKAALEEAHASNEKIKEYSTMLEEKNHTLEFLNKELEAFSYTVSHDLQSPLHTISGFAGMLSQTPAVTKDLEASRQLEIIERNAARMDGLINDLLRFSRLGKTSLQKTNTDMGELVQKTIAELREQMRLENIQLLIHPLPQVLADKKLLYQVWTNLLSNAVKFTSAVPSPLIEISCKTSAGTAIFSIKDNGIGFNPDLGDPFGVFKRLHRQDEYKGTGIGLAIVQRIIERHGGEVWARSAPGQGATFYFTLPG